MYIFLAFQCHNSLPYIMDICIWSFLAHTNSFKTIHTYISLPLKDPTAPVRVCLYRRVCATPASTVLAVKQPRPLSISHVQLASLVQLEALLPSFVSEVCVISLFDFSLSEISDFDGINIQS